MSNARDQRRRALGAPLADRNLSSPGHVHASGVPTRDDRCIAQLDGMCVKGSIAVPTKLKLSRVHFTTLGTPLIAYR
jgi:hypothetical protein